jgi:uncharacterized protein YbbK (DUF523 family)
MNHYSKPIVISACLAGYKTKYDGGHNEDVRLRRLVEQKKAVVVCPESSAGLPIPRVPSEIVGGDGTDVLNGKARVLSREGEDVTQEFLYGAQKTLQLVQKVGASVVIFKERSPSCGVTTIYDGSFSRSKKPGLGVTAALLSQHGITLYTEEDCEEFLRSLEEKG